MTDNISVEFKAFCPECGAELEINDPSGKAQPDTPMICPTHGNVGVFEDIREKVVKDVARKFEDDLMESIRNAGFTVKRD